MKVRQIGIDVDALPIGTELAIVLTATYWDSFIEEDDLWIGTTGYPKSDLITTLVLFPNDRPFLDFELQERQQSGDDSLPFNDQRRIFYSPDKTEL